MIGIDSKLYLFITVAVEVIFLSIVCIFLAIPIFTLPIVILLYCQIGGNIASDRKLFYFSNWNKKKVRPFLLFILTGIFSLYSSLMLTEMSDFFISRLIISLILSFNFVAGIFVIKYETKFFANVRTAFFYTAANFHKTILPVFLFIVMMSQLNGLLSGYVVAALAIVICYFIFKLNYKAIEKNFIES